MSRPFSLEWLRTSIFSAGQKTAVQCTIVHNDAQCAFAANLGVVNATFSRCYTCEREFPIPPQDNIRRTPCKSLSRNTRMRFKAR
jgi:hypothetical protein